MRSGDGYRFLLIPYTVSISDAIHSQFRPHIKIYQEGHTMSAQELQAILDLECEARYEYFLDVTGEEREVWILINSDEHFLKLHSDEQGGLEYLPLWPTAEFAEAYADSESDLTPRSIPLPQFLNRWLPGLDKDGIEVGVFPGSDNSVWITDPKDLEKDLRDELDRF